MTSFDPTADSAEAKGHQTAPAERNAVGNGSERTTAAADNATAGAAAAETTPAPDADPAESAAAGPESDDSDPRALLEQALAESAAHQDRILRLQAEFENYKRRVLKEHQDSLRYALSPLVTEIATVLDNLERAVDHAQGSAEQSPGALLEGIEMVVRQLQEALGRFGVIRIEAVGKAFDPERHEAMTVVETNDVPEHQVLQEFQAGYLLHDRVIRPARVSVAKRAGEAGGTPSSTEG